MTEQGRVMTAYHAENRSFMNLQTLVCGLLAVGIHFALLSLEMPGTHGIPTSGLGSLSLRVIHPEPPFPQPGKTAPETTQDSNTPAASPPQETRKDIPTVAKAPSTPEPIKAKRRVTPAPPTSDREVPVLRKLDAVPPLSRRGPPVDPSEDFEAYSPPENTEKGGIGHPESGMPSSAEDHALGNDALLGSTGGSRNELGPGATTYAMPEYEKNRPPDYPRLARRRGYEGQTRLNVEVLKTGKVGRIEIAASSGFDLLDEAALDAVKGWRFVPGTRDGERISQWVVVPVRFRLD